MKTSVNTAPDPASPKRDLGRWMTLYWVIIAMLAIVVDGALMGLFAPAVARGPAASAATIGLIFSISMLMLAAFILGGSTLSTIYGRKRFLSYGLIGVTITSILAMLAPAADMLVPVRALAGMMAALVHPLSLAIILVTSDMQERPKALRLYSAALASSAG